MTIGPDSDETDDVARYTVPFDPFELLDWRPAEAVAWVAWQNPKLFRSRSEERLQPHGSLTRMLGVRDEQEPQKPQQLEEAWGALQGALRSGRVKAVGRRSGSQAWQHDPGGNTAVHEPIPATAWAGMELGSDLDLDVLVVNGVPVYTDWRLNPNDVDDLAKDYTGNIFKNDTEQHISEAFEACKPQNRSRGWLKANDSHIRDWIKNNKDRTYSIRNIRRIRSGLRKRGLIQYPPA